MLDNIPVERVLEAVEELADYLGVREQVPGDRLFLLLRCGGTQECVQEIARELGLPIRISLSYVPEGFQPDSTERFETEALAKTDWTGHGFEGITAQVALPQNLPMFGSSSLEGYVIRVRVSEGCGRRPETFVALMAHEISHVLLASLCHPHRDNEMYTDLVPIVLGFGDLTMAGRKSIQSSTVGDTTTTRTTTYGYLKDSHFQSAYERVRAILRSNQDRQKHLAELAEELHRTLGVCERRLTEFREHLSYLDAIRVLKMREKDALKIVQFHAWDYVRNREMEIARVRTVLEKADQFVQPVGHYKRSVVQQIENHKGNLEAVHPPLEALLKSISRDAKLLRRYRPLLYRLRNNSLLQWLGNRFRRVK